MSQPDYDAIARFVFEVGHLRNVPRTGWTLARASSAESVAGHTSRTALIAYVLAISEGVNPHTCALLALLHDLPETRTGDQHHLAQRYLEHGAAVDQRVFEEQISDLPESVLEYLRRDIEVLLDPSSPVTSVVKDADILDSIAFVREAFMAEPLLQSRWIGYLRERLCTTSAKALANTIEENDPNEWWLRAMGEL